EWSRGLVDLYKREFHYISYGITGRLGGLLARWFGYPSLFLAGAVSAVVGIVVRLVGFRWS
ncbi:hypothetical protein ACVGXY_15295, partial [Enterobacter intestinihominis]